MNQHRLWREVRPHEPCPICGATTWCAVSTDGRVAMCMRVHDGPRVACTKSNNRGEEYSLYFSGDGPRDPATYQPAPEAPVAPADVLDRVYGALLAHLSLSFADREALRARGLSDAEIDARGYRSLLAGERAAATRAVRAACPDVDLALVPGFYRRGKSVALGGDAGIVVPVRNAASLVVALKIRRHQVDKDEPKYRWLSSKSHDGPSPGSPAHVPAWTGDWSTARVTEGELKADVATVLSGIPTIAVPGATCARSALPALLELGVRRVLLAWDADKSKRPEKNKTNWVAGGLEIAAHLYREAGLEVAVEHWPADAGKGLDDVLAGGHADQVQVYEGQKAWRVVAEVLRRAGRTPRQETLQLAGLGPEDGGAGPGGGDGGDGPPPDDGGDDWSADLPRDKHGALQNTFAVLCAILRSAPEYSGLFAFDEMALRPVRNGKPISDGDVGRLREAVEHRYGFSPAEANLRSAILTVSEEKRFHPVRAYLAALPAWDGVERIDHIPVEVLGAHATRLTRRKLRCWFISAVARAMEPGCKVDSVLVLVGAQGGKKSTFFAVLAGEWFSDTHMDLSNKDAYMQLGEAWVYEWGEIEKIIQRRGADEVKAFLTSRHDTFRPPFGRTVIKAPRSTVIVGTTNEPELLTDPTGSRRFWIVPVGRAINLVTLREWRPQLWAEAVAAYRAGEHWWLDDQEEAAREIAARRHAQADPWEEVVSKWLVAEGDKPSLAPAAPPLTTQVIMGQALRLEPHQQNQAAMNRVGRVMRALGYEGGGRERDADGRLLRVWKPAAGPPETEVDPPEDAQAAE